MATHDEHPQSTLRPWLGVSAITASLFVFLTTELMPVGLLTPVSGSLGISVGVAGLMVTLYGVSAGLGVPFILAAALWALAALSTVTVGQRFAVVRKQALAEAAATREDRA